MRLFATLMLLAGAFLVTLVAAQQASGPQRNVGSAGHVLRKAHRQRERLARPSLSEQHRSGD